MAVRIAAVMRQIHNFFERGYLQSTFTVVGGVLSPAPPDGYVYILGSADHDGVWQTVDGALQDVPDGLPDETFSGLVYDLHPPNDFLALCEEIAEYDAKNPAGALQSESFGDYSYTRAGGADGAQSWQTAFDARLAPFRRMFTEVGA